MTMTIEMAMAPFLGVCDAPYKAAKEAAKDGAAAGYMCTYVPEELLHAAGYLPVRVLGWSDGTQNADSLIQSYACSLARGALEAGLSGTLDFLSLMIFPHTCDTIQNLTDIWKRNVSSMKHFALSVPVETGTDHAVTYFLNELRRLKAFLEAQGRPVTDGAVRAAILLYDQHRKAMRALYAEHRKNPSAIGARGLAAVALSAFYVPRTQHLAWLTQLLAAVGHTASLPDAKPRVVVLGSVCQDIGYLDAIESAGCVVVDDDLCTGARPFAVEAVEDADPLRALARMYLDRRTCASKHRDGYDPGAEIAKRAREAGARGVIFLFTKFCDPWAFDYPRMREALDNVQVPSLLLEIEQNQPPSAHFQTRVAAFSEMLGATTQGDQS
ncbi:MAG TPA: 2-hydroxyacyl-CoA dehydratase family protein [Candidatus Hydrogenedentes bacterium]|nr:2-hydroxyacyl-CoA dehydratase family protein [Candidatus Hydrogenedentota bacterium]